MENNAYVLLKHPRSSLNLKVSRLVIFHPISTSNCLLVNLFHKSNICDSVLSHSQIVLLHTFSFKILQALANFAAGEHSAGFKIGWVQQKQSKTKSNTFFINRIAIAGIVFNSFLINVTKKILTLYVIWVAGCGTLLSTASKYFICRHHRNATNV